MKEIEIDNLIEMLEDSRKIVGNVEVYGWDSQNGNIETFPITGMYYTGNHIKLTTISKLEILKIDGLIKTLKASRELINSVGVYGWDNRNDNVKTFPITGLNCEGDHIELTN